MDKELDEILRDMGIGTEEPTFEGMKQATIASTKEIIKAHAVFLKRVEKATTPFEVVNAAMMLKADMDRINLEF